MDYKLSRRRFVQIAALAGSLATLSSPLSSTIFARPSDLKLLGVSSGPLPSTDTDTPEVPFTDAGGGAGLAMTARLALPLVISSLNLSTGRAQPVQVPQRLRDGLTPVISSNEALTGFTVLSDGSFVVAITPVAGSKNESDPTRIVHLGTPASAVTIGGLRPDESLGDLVNTVDGAVMGLITKRNGGAPARVVTVDPRSGATSDVQTLNLPARWRINTLAEAPGGVLYTTAVSRDGETSLVRIAPSGKGATELVRLSTGGTIWNNGLQSLIYAPSGQLLAFGALRYETPNAVYSVDVSSGVMTRLAEFDASRLAVTSA